MNLLDIPGRRIVAALPGPELTPPIQQAVKDLDPAGFVLFDRNLKTAFQTVDLIAGLKAALGRPLFLSIDQEGGRVNRLKAIHQAFLGLPEGREQGRWDLPRLETVWEKVGACLAALGFNVDFAPVADLDEGSATNGIGARSFGTDPLQTTACAEAVMEGLKRAGVASCLKHFPGLGGTELDTHQALAVSPHSLSDLENHTLPYRHLASQVPLVMSAHAHFPALDGPIPLPGTFSSILLKDWLRGRIGFPGLSISDDLGMGGLASFGPPETRAFRAWEAGCDLALFCQDLDAPRRARDQAASRVQRYGSTPEDEEALTRLESFLTDYPGSEGNPADFETSAAGLAALLSRDN